MTGRREARYQRSGEGPWSTSRWAPAAASSPRPRPATSSIPALLLLLAEEPRHGYRLVDALLRLGFGPFDRPSVYRALADLESDGLLRSWSASPTAGSTRHVYALTEDGLTALEAWMTVVDEQRARLAAVLKRYDALLERSADISFPALERRRRPARVDVAFRPMSPEAEWVTAAPSPRLAPFIDGYVGYRMTGFPPGYTGACRPAT